MDCIVIILLSVNWLAYIPFHYS